MNFASLLRPTNIEDFVGQRHLVGADSAYYKLIVAGKIPHSFFFGPPGSGKTTLSRIIASLIGLPFFELNATTLKVDDIRKIVDRHNGSLQKPLIFIDESHRLTKTQQEVLLPIMENSLAIIIGASTENPFFALTGGIRSRSMLFEFLPLEKGDIVSLIDKAVGKFKFQISDEAKEYVAYTCSGDARAALTLLEYACTIKSIVDLDVVRELKKASIGEGSCEDETHYNLASALIKSVRGSNLDASIHYLARLISSGEEPRFIARRLAILASEDIGNANPNALILANSVFSLVASLGYPEARIPLSQLTIYLACSPKSNSAIKAIDGELKNVKNGFTPEVPLYLKDAHYDEAKKLGRGQGYLCPHDFGGYVEQEYMSQKPNEVSLCLVGFEKTLKEWLDKIKNSA